jgi:KDO2-lipid IV(A) lauroyltransferase
MKKLQYFLVILFSKFLMLLPKSFRRNIFKALAYITYLVFSKNKKVIEANLRFVYHDKISQKEIKEIQKSCYKKLFLTVLSIIENEHLTKDEIESIVEFEGKEYIDKLQKEDQQFIYITAHLGNLDILGVIIGHFFGKTTHVQQKIKNPYLSDYMQKQREKYGIRVIEKYGAMKKLFLALKRGEIISLVIDQNTNPKYASKVKFLGKDELQLTTSTTLAKRFNIPILPVFIVGEEDKYKVIFKEPIYPHDKSEDELNQLQADVMSEMIFNYPKEWFWCHKRFKNSNPSLYQN